MTLHEFVVGSLAGLAEPKIEPEIVFRLHSPVDHEMTLYELVDAIDWVAHGYEIVRSSYPDWDFQAADAVADSAFHARLLVGPMLRISDLGNEPVTTLEAFSLGLSCDGRHIETGKGGDVLGNPLSALLHLMRILEEDPDAEPLQAGDIVTTGTVTAAHSINPGERWLSRKALGTYRHANVIVALSQARRSGDESMTGSIAQPRALASRAKPAAPDSACARPSAVRGWGR